MDIDRQIGIYLFMYMYKYLFILFFFDEPVTLHPHQRAEGVRAGPFRPVRA